MFDGNLELSLLKEEERTLGKISGKLQDYLTRLKIEELALVSLIRAKSTTAEEREHHIKSTVSTQEALKDMFSIEVNSEPLLDLAVNSNLILSQQRINVDEDFERETLGSLNHLEEYLEQNFHQMRGFEEEEEEAEESDEGLFDFKTAFG